MRAGAGPCTLVVRDHGTNVVAVALAKTAATVRKCAFSPIARERVGVEGWGGNWAPTGGLQYQTHMQAPKYDVQFLRSEAFRSSSSSSSSSSRTRQIKEC